MTETVRSIVTGGEVNKLRSLSQKDIDVELNNYFQTNFGGAAEIPHYALYQCVETGLIFAYPMIPGNESFYGWIGSFNEYFPVDRWEYNQVSMRLEQLMADVTSRPIRVLDIGCGDGKFLKKLAGKFDQIELTGLDVSEKSLSKVNDSRIETIHGDTSLLAKMNRRWDVVTAFHLIEHIPDPIGFFKDMHQILFNSESRGFVSCPLSPMFFESHFFDILNHPPHHLTRWNPENMKAVCLKNNFECEVILPKASPLGDRIKYTLRMKFFWRQKPRLREMIRTYIANFPTVMGVVKAQVFRKKLNGEVLPDLMLSELWKDD